MYTHMMPVIAGIFLALTTMSSASAQVAQDSSDPETTTTSTPARPVDDAAIQQRVADQLKADAVLKGEKIFVEVKDGMAVLSGTASHLPAIERAVAIAQATRGVLGVEHQLQIQRRGKAPAANGQLEELIWEALRDSAAGVVHANLTVAAAGGKVTLTGSVPRPQHLEFVRQLVSEVQGVEQVEIALTIQSPTGEASQDAPAPPTGRDSEAIIQDVRERLEWDAVVDAEKIVITENAGIVVLSGEVGSASQKSNALYDATVSGTGRADASGLKVVPWTSESAPKQPAETRSDEAVKKAVTNVLVSHPRIGESAVEVEVLQGVVSLSGAVTTLAAAREASKAAGFVHGVKEVRNALVIESPDPPDDELLGAYVRNAIRRDAYLDIYDIDASVSGGSVQLTGMVETIHKKVRAEEVVSRITGVKTVQNDLQVQEKEAVLAYDPHVDTMDWRELAWWTGRPPANAVKLTDPQLIEAIETQYFWSPFVNGSAINISALDGNVTLRGTADSLNAAQAAEANAVEAGAISVQNELVVQ